jgi:hypothetical protein
MRRADHDDSLGLGSMPFHGIRIMYQYHTVTRTSTKSMGVRDRVSVDDDGDSSESSEIPD